MALSSSQRGAESRTPPPPDQLAAFYKLVDKVVIAGHLHRHARNADQSAQAAVQAEALFGGDDSLVVVRLRYGESESLVGLSLAASSAEIDALLRRSFAVLVSLIPLLLRRLEANTLLPGTLREEELDFEAYAQAALFKAANRPVPLLLRCAPRRQRWDTPLCWMSCLGAWIIYGTRCGRNMSAKWWNRLCSKYWTLSLELPA